MSTFVATQRARQNLRFCEMFYHARDGSIPPTTHAGLSPDSFLLHPGQSVNACATIQVLQSANQVPIFQEQLSRQHLCHL